MILFPIVLLLATEPAPIQNREAMYRAMLNAVVARSRVLEIREAETVNMAALRQAEAIHARAVAEYEKLLAKEREQAKADAACVPDLELKWQCPKN